MKLALLEIAPELAEEAFAILRDAGALILGSVEAAPVLRVVVSHELLPPECEPDAKRPTPVVLMNVKPHGDPAERRYRLEGFHLNPWAALRQLRTA